MINKFKRFISNIFQKKFNDKVYNSEVYKNGLKKILRNHKKLLIESKNDELAAEIKNIEFHLRVLNEGRKYYEQ